MNTLRKYVNNPQATQESFSVDGWFKTGDVMVLDDEGLLTVVDRRKELIKYKGLQGKHSYRCYQILNSNLPFVQLLPLSSKLSCSLIPKWQTQGLSVCIRRKIHLRCRCACDMLIYGILNRLTFPDPALISTERTSYRRTLTFSARHHLRRKQPSNKFIFG